MNEKLLQAILTELKGLRSDVKELREEVAASRTRNRATDGKDTGCGAPSDRVSVEGTGRRGAEAVQANEESDRSDCRNAHSVGQSSKQDTPKSFRSEHEAVFYYMLLPKEKNGLGLTREQAAKACRMLKEGQQNWNQFKLGALIYALSQNPLPEDPVVFARGCRDGKSGAREDFQAAEQKAQSVLEYLRKRVVFEE